MKKINKQRIKIEYLVHKKSITELSKIFSCARSTIRKKLKLYKILKENKCGKPTSDYRKKELQEIFKYKNKSHPYAYNICGCKEIKSKYSKTCSKCCNKNKKIAFLKLKKLKKGKLCIDCGKELSKEKYTRCIKCARKYFAKTHPDKFIGKNNNNYKDGYSLKSFYCEICGKKLCYNISPRKTGKCWHCSRFGLLKGEKHPNWQNGISKLPYPFEFDKDLKSEIRERDNYICQNCDMTEEEHLIVYGKNLFIHHIDHEKNNCKKENLITLCLQCNARVNFNRDYWINLFKEKMGRKLDATF